MIDYYCEMVMVIVGEEFDCEVVGDDCKTVGDNGGQLYYQVADGDDDGGTVDTWDWSWRWSVEGSECLVVEV